MVEMFDRIDCLGKAVLGISAQCAQCHTHKFDPLTHDEYYGLFAFLNNTHEARSSVHTPAQLEQIVSIRARVAKAEAALKASRPTWEAEMNAWAEGVTATLVPWTALEAIELGSVGGLNHPTQEEERVILTLGMHGPEIFVVTEPKLTGVTALRLEALRHGDLFQYGPGRHGPWALGEVEAFVQRPGSDAWEKMTLVDPSADFSEPESAAPPPADKPNEKRSIGPVDVLTGDPLGGEALLTGTAEYTIPLVEVIKLAIFFDTGNVWSKYSDFASNKLYSGATPRW